MYSDEVNRQLFSNWLPETSVGHILKTDLFDEAFGEGLYPLLNSRAEVITGLDLAFSISDASRYRYPDLRAVNADVRQLPFTGDSFDVIVSNSTLDHFTCRDEILVSLRELYRVLKPNGHMLITLDNPTNPAVRLRNSLPFGLLSRVRVVPYFVGQRFLDGNFNRF